MCTFRSFGSAMTPDKFCRFIGLDWRYLPDAADVQLLYSLHWLLPVSAFEILRDFGRFSLDAFDFIQNIWKILKAEVQNWRGFFEDSLGIFSHSPEFYGRVLSVILLETLSSFEIDTRIHTHTPVHWRWDSWDSWQILKGFWARGTHFGKFFLRFVHLQPQFFFLVSVTSWVETDRTHSHTHMLTHLKMLPRKLTADCKLFHGILLRFPN